MQTTPGVRECETIDVIYYCTLPEDLSLADQEQYEIPWSACRSRLFSTDCKAGEPSTFPKHLAVGTVIPLGILMKEFLRKEVIIGALLCA